VMGPRENCFRQFWKPVSRASGFPFSANAGTWARRREEEEQEGTCEKMSRAVSAVYDPRFRTSSSSVLPLHSSITSVT